MKRIPWSDLLPVGGLARGLVEGDPALAGLLTHSVDDAGLLASARLAAQRELPRAALVDAISGGLRRLEAPPAAFASAERLREPGVVTVVTGQQPGLLGGALMVLVKALGALAACERLEAAGIPAVPVFWHASEDDDHAEANHVLIRDGAELHRLQVSLPGGRRMLADTPLPQDLAGVMEAASELLGERADLALAMLRPRDGDTFGSWTGRYLAAHLGALGVVVVEPSTLRSAARAVAEFELRSPGALFDSVGRAQERVLAAGYPPALSLARRALVFEVQDGVRRRFDVRDGDLVAEDGTTGHADRLRERLAADPTAVSWNVVTRALAQDLALPVAAQVCGPAELGYVSLLREAHDLLGVPQPAALLRPGATLVDRDVERACRRLEVEPEAVVRHGTAALPSRPPPPPEIAALRAALDALPSDPSPSVTRRRRELGRQLDLYAEAWSRAVADRDAVDTRRRVVALAGLRPRGAFAERSLSPLPWLARHGMAFFDRLKDAVAGGDHVLLFEEDI